MKRLFLILLVLNVSYSFSQNITDGVAIELEYQVASESTAEYHLPGWSIGGSISKRFSEIRDKYPLILSIGYMTYKPKTVKYGNTEEFIYGANDVDLWSEYYSYKIRSVPIKISTSFKLGKILISPGLGLAFKKITQDWSYTNYTQDSENQIIDEMKYISGISSLQVEFPIKNSISGFFRLERHSNSSLQYTQQGLEEGLFSDDYMYANPFRVTGSNASSEYLNESFSEELLISNDNMNERWFIFGVKYYFNNKN